VTRRARHARTSPGGWPLDDAEKERLRRRRREVRVFVAGSINVDIMLYLDEWPAQDTAATVSGARIAMGGHAGNCAEAFAGLETPCYVSGAVGTDDYGRMAVSHLENRGVKTDFIARMEGENTGTVYIPVCGKEHRLLLHRGANNGHRGAVLDQAASVNADALIVFDPSRHVIDRFIADIRSAQAHRPMTVWSPASVNMDRETLNALLPHIDWLIVNSGEHDMINNILGRQSESIRGLNLAVTKGEAGSAARYEGDWFEAPAFSAPVVDCVGAGDAFMAGFVLGLQAGLPVETALVVGNRSGAFAVQTEGARTRLKNIDEFLNMDAVFVR